MYCIYTMLTYWNNITSSIKLHGIRVYRLCFRKEKKKEPRSCFNFVTKEARIFESITLKWSFCVTSTIAGGGTSCRKQSSPAGGREASDLHAPIVPSACPARAPVESFKDCFFSVALSVLVYPKFCLVLKHCLVNLFVTSRFVSSR